MKDSRTFSTRIYLKVTHRNRMFTDDACRAISFSSNTWYKTSAPISSNYLPTPNFHYEGSDNLIAVIMFGRSMLSMYVDAAGGGLMTFGIHEYGRDGVLALNFPPSGGVPVRVPRLAPPKVDKRYAMLGLCSCSNTPSSLRMILEAPYKPPHSLGKYALVKAPNLALVPNVSCERKHRSKTPHRGAVKHSTVQTIKSTAVCRQGTRWPFS